MKKTAILCLLVVSMLVYIPQTHATKNSSSTKKEVVLTEAQTLRLNQINARLVQIQSMDKSLLSSQEKKVLRKEVRAMKAEARESGGGIYLSIGAVILIIVLLIILL
ncbi:MAG TPA: hypothetical protein PLK14_06835 [Sediminibacterium sp.]|nr:MAG: hypothetical protein B7X72_03610 [Sphingobacteriia bacterium 39-39-8]HQR93201.1 hypothetical protein [Sediminibacterium sp.]HQS54805.1 hypothetical protein [Sediminibacterium sp.]